MVCERRAVLNFLCQALIASNPKTHLILRSTSCQPFEKEYLWQWVACSVASLSLDWDLEGQGTRSFPLGFSTITRLETQSVGPSTLSIMPRRIMRSSSSFNFSRKAKGTFLGACITGEKFPSMVRWWTLDKLPISPKQSLYSLIKLEYSQSTDG